MRLLLACATLCGLATTSAFAQGTAFTYQGVLSLNGVAVSGSNDLPFTLYTAVSAGGIVGTSNVVNDLVMTNGLFTVTLDFGAQFDGNARWLDLSVRTNGAGAFSTLSPRQSVTPAPYAIYAGSAVSAATANAVANNSVSSLAIQSGLRKSLRWLRRAV